MRRHSLSTLVGLCILGLAARSWAVPVFMNSSMTGPNDDLGLIPDGWDNLFPDDPNSSPDTEGADGPHEIYNVSPDGGTFVAGAHATLQPPLGVEGIEQTLTGFTVGQQYRLDFYQSNLGFGTDNIGGTWSASANWQLYLDGQATGLFSDLLAPEAGELPNNSWFETSIFFSASSTTLVIGFGPNSVSGENAFLGIDGVRISAVPLPATAWLLVSGIVVLLSVRRRRADTSMT